ncbi:MAG: hypothetical protein IJ457_08610 [Clostridia bacterium]|nr:hypothetical protein [Clostridia bacterium]
MTELEKIEYAKSFIDDLANGINPLDGNPVPENDTLNNVRLSRCFFFVSDVLRRVVENGGISTVKVSRHKKALFSLSDEIKENLEVSQASVTVSDISRYLNSFVDTENMKTISAPSINRWLLHCGFLKSVELPNGKKRKLPTEQGNGIGIYSEEREGQYGTYVSVLFSSSAQRFIYDNLDAVIDFGNQE